MGSEDSLAEGRVLLGGLVVARSYPVRTSLLKQHYVP